mgnify:CR=1 FL=1
MVVYVSVFLFCPHGFSFARKLALFCLTKQKLTQFSSPEEAMHGGTIEYILYFFPSFARRGARQGGVV